MSKTTEYFMRQAIKKAQQGITKGQTPFGACIVKKGDIVSCAHNVVWSSTDITAHAEINAIRKACRKLKTINLSGCTIYSTCEPCPMCFSACHWAGIKQVVYGTKIADAKNFGFSELEITNQRMKQLGKSKMKIESGILRQENLELFKTWKQQLKSKAY
jgi:guanine deaminase